MSLSKQLLLAMGAAALVTTAFATPQAAQHKAKAKPVSIAIVEPLQHEAMNEIINGYRDGIKAAGIDADISVKNGQLDPNIEKSIFKELATDKTHIVAPIGSTLFQMAAATIPTKPLIGIAVSDNSVSSAVRNQTNPPRATAISDAINPTDQLNFMHSVLPKMTKIALVYSADDNIVSQVKDIEKVAKSMGIKVQELMVTSAPDLYTISHHVDSDAGCIFILKDHMIVSAIPQLAQQAQALQIPLITSDDGSVRGGGAFAFGITERQIGEASAKVTAAYIKGRPMKDLPIKMLNDYSVFLNAPMAIKEGYSEKQIEDLKSVAQSHGYPVISCTAASCGGDKKSS
jgi:putative ABC transport system substrate-binding protein